MALPSAMQAKYDRLKAEMAQNNATEVSNNEPVDVVQPEANQDQLANVTPIGNENSNVVDLSSRVDHQSFIRPTQPVPQDDGVDWKKLYDEGEQRWRTGHGITRTLKEENDVLKDKLALLEKSLEEIRASVIKPDTSDQITPEEVERYGDAFPTVEKISKKVSKEYVKTLEERLAKLETKAQDTSKDLRKTSGAAFYSLVQSRVGNLDEYIKNPKWQTYLQQRMPFSSMTFEEALVNGINSQDLDRVVEIYKNFKPDTTSINSMVSPSVAASNAAAVPPSKPRLKMSDFKQKSVAFQKGLIKKEEFDKIQEMYTQAGKEGRLEYGA